MTTVQEKILIVDDNPMMIEIAKKALSKAGYLVVSAVDTAQLEHLLKAEPPALILMDVQMPEVFGDDIAMVLRAARGLSVPIYLFSSLEEEELESRAIEAGIDGYICKRDGPDVLVSRVRSILDESSAAQGSR